MRNRPTDYHQTMRNAREASLRALQAQREALIGSWFWKVEAREGAMNDIVVSVLVAAREDEVVLQCAGRRRTLSWRGFEKEWKRWTTNAPPRPMVLERDLLWTNEAA